MLAVYNKELMQEKSFLVLMSWDFAFYAGIKKSFKIHQADTVHTWSYFLYLSRPFRRLSAAPHSVHTNGRN